MGAERMRIVAGTWRGREILAPKGATTRPTSDRVREAVFSAVRSRIGDLSGVRVLDGFAGSGALGLEALSRGADSATFIEPDRAARDAIARNAAALGAERLVTVVPGDLFRLGVRMIPGAPFALLFLDPPYRIVPAQVSRLLEDLAGGGSLAPEALVVYEHATGVAPDWPDGFCSQGGRRYGTTEVSYATYEGKRQS